MHWAAGQPQPRLQAAVQRSLGAPRSRGVRMVTHAMFERFTEKAIKVVMLAQEEARRLGERRAALSSSSPLGSENVIASGTFLLAMLCRANMSPVPSLSICSAAPPPVGACSPGQHLVLPCCSPETVVLSPDAGCRLLGRLQRAYGESSLADDRG